MRRIAWLSLVFAALLALPLGPVAAQAFTGSGQRATELFELKAGLAVFEMEHDGAGRFVVRLLNERGGRVDEVADQTGPFSGSRAMQIPNTGRYLLDITASGPWTVRLRGGEAATAGVTQVASTTAGPVRASPSFAQGEEAGAAAAAGRSSLGWFAGGLAGGTVAGPIGAAVAVALAGKSNASIPGPGVATGPDPLYVQGFEQGYLDRLRRQRKKRALIGGIVGTSLFVVAAIQLFDINGSGGGSGGGGTPPPPVEASLQPSH